MATKNDRWGDPRLIGEIEAREFLDSLKGTHGAIAERMRDLVKDGIPLRPTQQAWIKTHLQEVDTEQQTHIERISRIFQLATYINSCG